MSVLMIITVYGRIVYQILTTTIESERIENGHADREKRLRWHGARPDFAGSANMAASLRQVNPQWPPSSELRPTPAQETPERHLVIAGTGRAGTSFLVRYLTELGLDTTLARNGDRAGWDAEANAGLENMLISDADLPYVVKSPWICEYVDQDRKS